MTKTDLHCPGCGTKNVERHSYRNGAWHEKYECLTCSSEFYMPYIKMGINVKQPILKKCKLNKK